MKPLINTLSMQQFFGANNVCDQKLLLTFLCYLGHLKRREARLFKISGFSGGILEWRVK